jgi:hypothetical protein
MRPAQVEDLPHHKMRRSGKVSRIEPRAYPHKTLFEWAYPGGFHLYQ